MRRLFLLASCLALPLRGYGADYQIPFAAGEKVLVSQGFHGKSSHNSPGSFHAVDFAVPEDTDIYAARDGVVLDIDESHSEADFDPSFMEKGNRLLVRHDDGSIAIYAHLKWRGAKVKKGQRVTTKDRIGLSGNTGFSGGPHLHFSVVKDVPQGVSPTIPYTWITEAGSGQELKAGNSYARPE